MSRLEMSPRETGSGWLALKQQGLTVMLNTYKRPEMLKSAVEHYNACPIVASIRIIWCEAGSPPSTADWRVFSMSLQLLKLKFQSMQTIFVY